jgi:ankyrin repeat protein
VQELESKEDAKFDPRKYRSVLSQFEHLLSPSDMNRIKREFKSEASSLLREVLNSQDNNYFTPLHVASYFGDFK